MEGQRVVTNHQSEIVIDIEPLANHIKPEPVEEESEYDEYSEEYETHVGEEEETHFKTEPDDEHAFSVEGVKEEITEEEHYNDELQEEEGMGSVSEDESYDKSEEGTASNSELTIHALPGTSTEKDNMIYFEIPVINNTTKCKCVVCGAVFESYNKGNEYICANCLKKKDFSTPVQNVGIPISSKNLHVPGLAQSGDLLPHTAIGRPDKNNRDRPFECKICHKKCISTSDLSKHQLVHSGEKPYTCEVCSKTFNQLSNLIRHKSTHSDVKPFQCSICMKTFTQASYLKKHNLTHSGEKPYGCVVCLKKFSDYSTLSKHKLIHSGEKPYGCGICLKNFNQLASLRRHEVIHRDEKPFECTICKKRFAQSHHLKRHQTIHRVKYVNMSLPKYRGGKLNSELLLINRGVGHQMTQEITPETYRVAREMMQNLENEVNHQLGSETRREINNGPDGF